MHVFRVDTGYVNVCACVQDSAKFDYFILIGKRITNNHKMCPQAYGDGVVFYVRFSMRFSHRSILLVSSDQNITIFSPFFIRCARFQQTLVVKHFSLVRLDHKLHCNYDKE